MNNLSLADYFMLMQMTGGMPGQGFSAGGKVGPVEANLSQVENNRGNMTSGFASAPIGDLPMRASISGNINQGTGPTEYSIQPGVSTDLGPVSLSYNRMQMPKGGFDTVGANVNTEMGSFGYGRNFGDNPSNNFTYSVPMDNMHLNARLTMPDKGPMQIGGGLTVKDILGGNLGVQGTYTPDSKTLGILARYMKNF